MAADDAFLDKAIEGLVLYAFNKGEVCTCPSRALIQESIYDEFMERCLERIAAIKQGDPLDRETMIGPQVSQRQLEKIESYVQIGLRRGRRGADRRPPPELDDELGGGYYFEPTVLKGHNKMRVFQEEIFGPVLAVTTFRDEAEALRDRQRHDVRPRRRRVDPRRQPRVPDGPRDQGRARVDQLLPPVPGARRVRRLQGLRRRSREPPHDARPLHADQVPAGQLRPQPAWVSSDHGPTLSRGTRDGGGSSGHPGGARGDPSPRGRPRAAHVLPVRGLL